MNESPDDQNPGFESALKELEALVEQLETGELELDQSLRYFKRGVELSRHCQNLLDRAQLTIEQLSGPEEGAAPDEVEDPDQESGRS